MHKMFSLHSNTTLHPSGIRGGVRTEMYNNSLVFLVKNPFQVTRFDVLIEFKYMQMNHHLSIKSLGFFCPLLRDGNWKSVQKKEMRTIGIFVLKLCVWTQRYSSLLCFTFGNFLQSAEGIKYAGWNIYLHKELLRKRERYKHGERDVEWKWQRGGAEKTE